MAKRTTMTLSAPATRLLGQIAGAACHSADAEQHLVGELVAADLIARGANGRLQLTAAGSACLARLAHSDASPGTSFLAQHLDLAQRRIATAEGPLDVLIDEAESPLSWLARRKGRDGRALIEPIQLLAGERLRSQFTRAQMMPRVTANWNASVAQARRGADGSRSGAFTEATLAARQQLRNALNAAGPEFSGLLLDVCCFLKRLEDVERERGWPARSAKVVLQLALDRLARHFGLAAETSGRARAPVRAWRAAESVVAAEE